MKKLFVLCAVMIAVGACSSNEKKEMTDETKKSETMTDKKADASKDAKAGAEASMAASKSTCVLDKDTRVIEVKKTDAGGCELFYTKFGEAKSVASSGFGTQYCEEVKDRIQTNLNKAGFTCK